MKFVELNTFLKINLVVSSGGEAKRLIRSEQVKVNGEIETRNKRKLIAGDKVLIGDNLFIVTDNVCKKEV